MKTPIPLERLTVRTSRSGGPGGQNANKVSSKVEIRFHLDAADWLAPRVPARLGELFPRRITREGVFRLVSSRFRDQGRNLKDCLEKLGDCIRLAEKRPRRRVRTTPTGRSRKKRLETKRRHSRVKQQRRAVDSGDE